MVEGLGFLKLGVPFWGCPRNKDYSTLKVL